MFDRKPHRVMYLSRSIRGRIAAILVVGAVLFGMVIWWTQRTIHHRTYQGRTASEWFEIALLTPESQDDAEKAMRWIGQDSVPVLVGALCAETGRPGGSWRSAYDKLPGWIKARISPPTTARERSELARRLTIKMPEGLRRRVVAGAFAHFARLVRDPKTADRVLMLTGYLKTLKPSGELFAPLLIDLLDDADPALQMDAIASIAEYSRPRDGSGRCFRDAVPKLIALLHDDVAGTCSAALTALSRMGPAAEPAVPAIEGLGTEPGYFVATTYALWWIDHQTNRILPLVKSAANRDLPSLAVLEDMGPGAGFAVPELKEAITHPKIEIALASVKALARIDPSETELVASALLAWMDHPRTPSEYVVKSINLLGDLGLDSPGARISLERKLDSPDFEVRVASTQTLARLNERIRLREK